MAHGTPDWDVTAGAVTTYQLTDLGELAARLGSIVTFDRRGDLIWADDFERGLAKWDDFASGAGSSVALSTAAARNGRYSCLLTAGAAVDRYAQIQHFSPFFVLSRMGVEFSFRLPADIGHLRLTANMWDGVNNTRFSIKYDDAADTLYYEDSAGVYVSLATGLVLNTSATLFHTLKLVFDAATGMYVRAILNEDTYSLAGIAGPAAASATAPVFGVTIYLNGWALAASEAYVDDAILTQNEPP